MTLDISNDKPIRTTKIDSMNIVIGVPKRYVESTCANADCRKFLENIPYHECKVRVGSGEIFTRRFCEECYKKLDPITIGKSDEKVKNYKGRIIVKEIDREFGFTAKNDDEAKKYLRQKLHESVNENTRVFNVVVSDK